MDYFPVFMNLQGLPALVVGGGEVALRKASLLDDAGAKVRVVAPEVCQAMADKIDAAGWHWTQSVFETQHLDDVRVVIAATDQPDVNRTVFEAAEAQRLPVNVVDQPALCRFIMPAIVDRSPLMIAVSTSGGAPVLARHMRTKLEGIIPHQWGKLSGLIGKFRDSAKRVLPNPGERRMFWERLLDGPMTDMALNGRMEQAETLLISELANAKEEAKTARGAVYLVGAGPGNPDLLTFRALRLMQIADVVVYDNLVSPEIVNLIRRDAERIYVGKASSRHTLPQEDINQTLFRLAKEGKQVVRLKGGDPFIFGRGGEELSALLSLDIDIEVVPGITAASGAACYAGIPLTHRDYAQSCTFVTGHRRAGQETLDWARLTADTETVVVYMGVEQAPVICKELVARGRRQDTPVAVVQNATLPQQRVVTSTLGELPEAIVAAGIQSPAVIIIGEVVKLQGELGWFGGKENQ
ncbi:siroheme synthase CysG [Leeia oryzae]|uniref:siroheme synthase CysG n=1 Tax=Leeia oryzae TaxID=356662 RepID=UPI00035CB534|nr:siroheme synthase CysG [Leeia oryzae]